MTHYTGFYLLLIKNENMLPITKTVFYLAILLLLASSCTKEKNWVCYKTQDNYFPPSTPDENGTIVNKYTFIGTRAEARAEESASSSNKPYIKTECKRKF